MKKIYFSSIQVFLKFLESKVGLKMRATLVILLIGIGQSFAIDLYAQNKRLTLNMSNVSIKSVLEIIENQSDYFFMYEARNVDVDKKVTISVENESIPEILNNLFTNTNITYKIVNHQIALNNVSLSSAGQQIVKVTGHIVDTKGIPLPGVAIVIKGTTTGTITDGDGNYSFTNVPSNANLTFSFVGMKTIEIAVSGKSVINITLEEEAIGIEEVVAIGYGTMKKSDLTGSVVSADINAFRESSNVSIVQSLQGTVPGLNVGQVNSAGQNPTISIRGQNSFNSGNTAPLMVVDGVVFNGALIGLNPSDVESIDVLKDASSTAIYGSRAANGVLLITTKKGKNYGKPVINYTCSYTIQNPIQNLRALNKEGYLEKIRDAYWKEGYLAPDYTQPNPDFDPSVKLNTRALIDGYKNGTEFNWWDAGTQSGHIQEHNLSVRGQNDRTSYYTSIGYTDQLGFITNDKYKRFSVRTNLENKILDWFKVGVQSFVSSGDNSGASPNRGALFIMSPLVTPYDENGELLKNPAGTAQQNPFFSSNIGNYDKQLNLFANFYTDIDIPFIKGLSYRINYSHNYMLNRYFNSSEYAVNFTGEALKTNGTEYDWTFDNILSYSKSIQNHTVNVTLVAGREKREYESTTATAQSFSNLDLGYNNLSLGTNQFASSSAWNENSLYYMGRLHYGFKNKYLATFTVRRDGFSGFSKNNKFGIFPSGALAWVLSEESFFKEKLDWLEFLKIRTSYGANGNRTMGRYGTLAKVTYSKDYVFGDGGQSSFGEYINSMANLDLSWETTTGINLGLDFVLLKQRISGNIEYYNTNTKNILFDLQIPQISGFGSITSNIGKVYNHGTEFSITSANVKTDDFTWSTTLNFSANRNKIKSIMGVDTNGDGKEDDLVSSGLFIGEPINAIYDYKIKGLYQITDTDIPEGWLPGQYRLADLNKDGSITAALDREIIGYKDPSYRFSVTNNFNFRNWELRIFINSIQGGKNMYYGKNDPTYNWDSDNITASNLVKWDWWTPANPAAEYPYLLKKSPILPGYYDKRSFVRLQDVSLSYRFDKKLVNKIGVQDLKIYINGKNLYTWTKWKGWDPETGQGYDYGGMPTLRGYSLGIDLTF